MVEALPKTENGHRLTGWRALVARIGLETIGLAHRIDRSHCDLQHR